MAQMCRNPDCRSDSTQTVSSYYQCLSCGARNMAAGGFEMPPFGKPVSVAAEARRLSGMKHSNPCENPPPAAVGNIADIQRLQGDQMTTTEGLS